MQKQCVKPKGLLHRRCFWILGVIILWWLICIYHFSSSNPNQFAQGLSFLQSSSTQVLHSSFELPPTRSLSRAASSFQNLHNHQSGDHIDNTNACDGKYIYIHHLPKMFHEDLLANCSQPSPWKDICKVSSNGGLGPKLQVNKDNVFPRDGWFATNQFALELIFHNRMKQYKCLTEDSSKAALVYVPFYAGLDISRNLWGANVSVRDELPNALANWLERQEEWRVMGGRDHFMVCGRMTWDFRRLTDAENDWGNKLLLLDVVQNMSTLLIEKSPWHYNDYAIPYPTYFHPYKHSDVIEWQDRVRLHPRPSLFSFAGAPREEMEESIRGEVMEQCRGSRLCTLLECDKGESKCHSPLILMSLFQESVFCLQPQGDSATRRSIFDSMVAGCIPVFFHPHSAYIQYIWHLPQNHSDYSVFIPQDDIKHNLANIERILKSIPPHHVAHMREQVISLIPRLIYANPTTTSLLPDFEDAFDVAVQGLIDKVAEVRIKERQNGVMSMLFASM